MFRVGGNANLSVFRYQHEILALGDLTNSRPQCEKFCIAVEYRLNFMIYYPGYPDVLHMQINENDASHKKPC